MFGFSADKGVQTILEIPDMECSMCENHINEAIRREFQVRKVKSSHKKGETLIVSDEPLDEAKIRQVIADTGYTLKSVKTSE